MVTTGYNFPSTLGKALNRLFAYAGSFGTDGFLDDHGRRKLALFNQLCSCQAATGLFIALLNCFRDAQSGGYVWVLSFLPSVVSLEVLHLNSRYRYNTALHVYFILNPLLVCAVYLFKVDPGNDLSFFLYGILSVFLLRDSRQIVFSISLSMLCYFILFLERNKSDFPPVPADAVVYLLNEIMTILYIFYALILLVTESDSFQQRLKSANIHLREKNIRLEAQCRLIERKALLLEKKTVQLKDNDRLRNKLLSIISHDLKLPMVALRHLFHQVAERSVSQEEIDRFMPTIVNELDYSTILVENLLEWAKSQLESDGVKSCTLDLPQMIAECLQVLGPQLRNKNLVVKTQINAVKQARGDKDMIRLVLRNLVSNAIKFSTEGSHIIIGTQPSDDKVRIYVRDAGSGITTEQLNKIRENTFYSTNSTTNQPGTGLGIMLCKEFLAKNGSTLMMLSEPAHGCTFSFLLPVSES